MPVAAPFIAGVPVYGTLFSLTLNGAPILGIIDQASTPIGGSARGASDPPHQRPMPDTHL